MNGHTPGPWKLIPIGDLDFRRPGDDGASDQAIQAANGICPGIVWEFMQEGKANARLIAAAPELLEALQTFVKTGTVWESELPDSVGVALLAARVAIAKATHIPADESVQS